MPFCHSIAIRCSACRAAQGREGKGGERHYTTAISGSRWGPQRGRLSSASIGGPLALTVCVCRRALPVAPSYLRRPPTLPHKRPVVEQLHCRIPIVHVSAAYVQRRIQPFMRSLASHFGSPFSFAVNDDFRQWIFEHDIAAQHQ